MVLDPLGDLNGVLNFVFADQNSNFEKMGERNGPTSSNFGTYMLDIISIDCVNIVVFGSGDGPHSYG